MISDYEKYLREHQHERISIQGNKLNGVKYIAFIRKSSHGFWLVNVPELNGNPKFKRNWKIRSLQEIIDWLESCKAEIQNGLQNINKGEEK